MRRSVIDIGTNTVKLLVADVRDGEVIPVFATEQTTRLGEGANASGSLSASAISRTVAAIAGFVAQARQHGATSIRAFTTSAVRDAANRQEFLNAVGLEVAVLSGQREAELIFRGVCSDPAWACRPLLVMDIGGGSVEVIQGKGGMVEKWKSLPIGAVRMTERFGEDFPALSGFLRTTFRQELRGFEAHPFVATGGANTTLARIAGHARLTRDEAVVWVARLHAMTLDQRRQVPGLPADRADIIVAGSAALAFAMEALGVYELTVSTRNLRYGALLD